MIKIISDYVSNSMVFGSAPLPVLRIPFKGGAGAWDVRTTWEAGRVRSGGRGGADVSNDTTWEAGRGRSGADVSNAEQ